MNPSLRESFQHLWEQRLQSNLPILLPPVLGALLYLPALHGGLVWDDPLYLHHPLYRDPGATMGALSRPFLLSPNYYRPLAVGTFLLSGAQPWINHLVNILLHAMNAGLVTALSMGVMGRPRAGSKMYQLGLAAGLIYTAHPALVEGVAFISGRFDLLATSFLLLALLSDLVLRGRRWIQPLAVGMAVFLALLSKEMAAAFILVLPLWHLGLQGFDQWTASQGAGGQAVGQEKVSLKPGRSGKQPRWKSLFAENGLTYGGAILALAGYCALRYLSLGYLYLPESGRAVQTGAFLQHLLLIGRSMAEYTLLSLWPFGTLAPIHYSAQPIPVGDLSAWAALGMSLAVFFLLFRWIRLAPNSGWLAAGTYVSLLPVLNLVPLELGGGAFVAERFLVFPLALLVLAVGAYLRLNKGTGGMGYGEWGSHAG